VLAGVGGCWRAVDNSSGRWMTKVGGGWRFRTVENGRDFVGLVWQIIAYYNYNYNDDVDSVSI
jgi:hypothetical protein